MRAAVAVLLAGVLAPAVAAGAAEPPVQCGPAPASRTPDYVAAIGAGGVPPAATAPIAVLDSGADAASPELAGKLRDPTNTVDSSGTRDASGHGTAVAGIAAGASDRLRGVSPGTPVVAVKVFDDSGATDTDALVKGIDAAVAAGARTINISAAAPPADAPPGAARLIGDAIARAVNAGAVVVASAGNEGAGAVDVPARYPHVLAVGALTDGAAAAFSNFGPGLDVMAPGDGLVAPVPQSVCASGYGLASGTSFAAPVAAGAAAWLGAARPELDATQRVEVLRASAADLAGPGWDAMTGFGRIDLAAALAAPAPAREREVDDDPVWVTGRYAARHPRVADPRRPTGTVTGSVAPHDPADVVRVGVAKGRRLAVDVDAAAAVGVGVWDDRAAPYAVTTRSARGRVAARSGSGTLRLRTPRARRAATWFVGISAPGAATAVGYTLRVRLAR